MNTKTIAAIIAVIIIVFAAAAFILLQDNGKEGNTKLYVGNGGVTIDNCETYAMESDTTASDDLFIRAGYTIKEWNTEADGTGTSYGFGVTAKGSMKLYAVWSESSYCTFKYELKNGNTERIYLDHDGESDDISVYGLVILHSSNAALRIPLTLTVTDAKTSGEHYSVLLQSDDSMKKIGIDLVGIRNADVSTKADCTEISFTVIGDSVKLYTAISNTEKGGILCGNGGYGSYVNYGFFQYQINRTISTEPFTMDGYKISKWNTKADGTGTSYEFGTAIPESLVLYAIWEKA